MDKASFSSPHRCRRPRIYHKGPAAAHRGGPSRRRLYSVPMTDVRVRSGFVLRCLALSVALALGAGSVFRPKPAPAPEPPPPPPPRVDTVIVTREVPPPLPEGAPVELCLSSGYPLKIHLAANGDTLMGERRVPKKELTGL